MTSLKRPAEQPLLPFRNPKQPRREMKGRDGDTARPSELEGKLSQWMRATYSVVVSFVPRWAPGTQPPDNSNGEETTSTSSISSTSSIDTPRQTPAPEVIVVGSDSEGSQAGHIQRLQKTPTLVSNPKPTPSQTYLSSFPSSFASSSTSSSRMPSSSVRNISTSTSRFSVRLEGGILQSTPKPRHTAVSRSRTPTDVFPPLSRSSLRRDLSEHSLPKIASLNLNTSPQSSQRSSQISPSSFMAASRMPKRIAPSKKRPRRHREHIFANVHKAYVQRTKREQMEEMVQRLYEIRRRKGYTSNFEDFQGLLDYEEKVERLHLGRASPPSEDQNIAFLKRAIDNAKTTMDSPKPSKPFTPTLELLQISHRAKDEAIERRIRPPIPSKLSEKEDQEVTALLRKSGEVSRVARERVHDRDLLGLRPCQWLNDEIINFYGALIQGRSDASKENTAKGKGRAPLNIHYFSSFFWPKLTQEGYEKAKLNKWTKKFDIFEKDAVLMAVNHGNSHWTAACINFRKKRVESYDSLGSKSGNAKVIRALRIYLEREHMDKKKIPFDFTGWEEWAPESTPRQENSFDCGVFTMHFLEALSRGEELFAFSQQNMPYLRRRMIWEIGNAQLRGGHYS